MLEPAMLHKEAILNGLKKHIYEDEMSYYSGWNGYTLPEIPNEFDGCDYRFAILDGDKVIGYFCYTYDMHSKCLRNFGLYSFDRGNPIIGKDILYEIKRIIKEYQPHRMEWRMVGGNPVEKHYDKFCKRYNGKKFVLTDVFKDRYGNYHNDVIMKSYLTRVIKVTNFEYIKQMGIKELAILLGCIWSDFDNHIRVINGDVVWDSFDSIEEWLEMERGKDDKA